MPCDTVNFNVEARLFLAFPYRSFDGDFPFFNAAAGHHPDIAVLVMLLHHQNFALFVLQYNSYATYPHNIAPITPAATTIAIGLTLNFPTRMTVPKVIRHGTRLIVSKALCPIKITAAPMRPTVTGLIPAKAPSMALLSLNLLIK